jgi:hypothetical protein
MALQRLFAILLLAFIAAGATGQQRQGVLVFHADYENREKASDVATLTAEAPSANDALQVDCAVARAGRCSMLARLRMDRRYVSAGAHRSESSTMRMPETNYHPGDRFRYRFSLLVDDDWIADSRASIDAVWQFKHFSSAPDMFIAIKGETLVWRVLESKQITLTTGLPRGEWLDFDFTVYWSDGADGRAELSITHVNTRKRLNFLHEGPNMSKASRHGGYLKWGLYKPGQLQRSDVFPTRVVHHDEISVFRLH